MAGQQRERAFHGLDDSFMDHGICADEVRLAAHDGTVRGDFYRELGRGLRDQEATKRAKRVCEQCPVQFDCLEFAIEGRIIDGVWGGTTGDERHALARRRRRRAVGV